MVFTRCFGAVVCTTLSLVFIDEAQEAEIQNMLLGPDIPEI